ncbi:hypothetical protein SCE1572_08185 [Sorangium cellulosum So0157-2]|uniref:MerC domain-containing protein n=1 Tax=Sorangium cellulosum So0157-2 TaxID=1254432 RepID=S4XQ07_SORCE|nr:hypothetical protein SCE1572_08185 [Sorangium cellulosum So0157-2]
MVGSGLSMLCAVHCLAAPLLSAALPLLAGEGVELGAFLVLLALGLAALTALRALEGAEEGPLGPALVVLGSALLVAAHLANRRALRARAGCC